MPKQHWDKQSLIHEFRRTRKTLEQTLFTGKERLEAHWQRLVEHRVCIGITGFSGSGKSTLITSLINQLLQHEKAQLPGFSPVLGGRLLWAKLHPGAPGIAQEFPYNAYYQGLACDKPQWPESTRDISASSLELRIRRASTSANPLRSKDYSLWVELRDYPGEWLLDLALADLSFIDWCNLCQARFDAHLQLPLLQELRSLNPLATADPSHLSHLAERFAQFAQEGLAQAPDLRFVMPGRYLIHQGFSPSKMPFVPLFLRQCQRAHLLEASSDSYFACMASAFERYKQQWVKPFVEQAFSGLDRQLVLVDVINSLHQGPNYLDALVEALASVSEAFEYGKQWPFLQWAMPKIDKVVFAATKIDQVVAAEHEAVRQFLGLLVKKAYLTSAQQGAKPHTEALAAVRATTEEQHGKYPGILGLSSEGEALGYVHPTMPSAWPRDEHWPTYTQWSLPKLKPPRGLHYRNADVLPHIRLDSLLETLLGDQCQ